MERQEIFNRIVDIIHHNYLSAGEKLTEDTNLRDDLNADSLDLSCVGLDIETTFQVEITDAELEGMDTPTVGSIVDLVQKKLEGRP